MFKIGFDFPFRVAQVSFSLMRDPSLPRVFESPKYNSSLYKVAVIASQIFIYFRPQYTTQLIATFIRVLPTFNQVWLGGENAPTKEEWIGVLGDAIFLLAYVSSRENPILITTEKATRVALYVLATAFMTVPLIQAAISHVITSINTTIAEKTQSINTTITQKIDTLTFQKLTNVAASHDYLNKIGTIYDSIQCIRNCQQQEHHKIENYYSKLTGMLLQGRIQIKDTDIVAKLIKIKAILDYIQAMIKSLETGDKIIKQCIENLELTKELYKECLEDLDNLDRSQFWTTIKTVKEQMTNSKHSTLRISILKNTKDMNDKLTSLLIAKLSKNDNSNLSLLVTEFEEALTSLSSSMRSFSIEPTNSATMSNSASSKVMNVCTFPYMLPLPETTIIGEEHFKGTDIHFNWTQQRKEMQLLYAISEQITQTSIFNLQRQQDEITCLLSLNKS